MVLKAPLSPEGGIELIRGAVRDIGVRRPPGAKTLDAGGGAPSILQASEHAVPIYTLAMGSALHEDYLQRARMVGWRHIIEKGGQFGLADVKSDSNGALRMSAITWGPLVNGFTEAATIAEKLTHGPEDYEAKVIEAPALNVAAFWIDGPNSMFVPYIGFDHVAPIEPGKFHQFLIDRAQRKLADLHIQEHKPRDEPSPDPA